MAVNKVVYGKNTLIDLSGDTVTPDKLANGVTAHNKAGVKITGTLQMYELPVLNASYPQDASVIESASASATFSVVIATPGKPAEYTYQWYKDGAKVSGATNSSYIMTGLTSAGSHTVYCEVINKAGLVTSRIAKCTVKSCLPTYTYNGTHSLVREGAYGWKLTLKTSGDLNFSYLPSDRVDLFLLGGGAGGGNRGNGSTSGGGGGGYTLTKKGIQIYNGRVEIGGGGAGGARGGTTSAFGYSAVGGYPGASGNGGGGAGGSGGGARYYKGGSNGGDGTTASDGGYKGGTGQHTTTREFGESTGTLYAGGGSGGKYGAGGDGGGGASNTAGGTNTGGGGGGGDSGYGAKGGSGIVVIRNAR